MSRALEGPASPGWGAEPAPCEGRERFRGRAAGLWGWALGPCPRRWQFCRASKGSEA